MNDKEKGEREREGKRGRQRTLKGPRGRERDTRYKITLGRKRERERDDTNIRRQTEEKARRDRRESEQSDGAHAPAVTTRPSDREGEDMDETKDKRRTKLQLAACSP